MALSPRVLVADDDPAVLEALRILLRHAGMEVDAVATPEAAIAAVEGGDFDAALLDLNFRRGATSGREGLDLLEVVRALDEALPVVVMTGWGTVAGAVRALRLGARDYVEKPWSDEHLVATLRTQVALRRARAPGPPPGEVPPLIAGAPAMKPVLRLLRRVAPSRANVLITGEHGTGKEVIARWLHAHSDRARGPFVTVHAGALADGVLESELFGHVRGAFTGAVADRRGYFEAADGGTLFLDEIGTMPAAQQVALLRVLESGEFQRVGSARERSADVRVLSATNADMDREVAEGRFRPDLLYRLNVVRIHLPPLRERRQDVPALAAHFLAHAAAEFGRDVTGFDEGVVAALRRHPWPGNVRELQNVIQRAVLVSAGGVVTVRDLGLDRPAPAAGTLDCLPLHRAEEVLVRRALEESGGNVSQAAAVLGISRGSLYRRMEKFGLRDTPDEPVPVPL